MKYAYSMEKSEHVLHYIVEVQSNYHKQMSSEKTRCRYVYTVHLIIVTKIIII